jgi:hypothetical protein
MAEPELGNAGLIRKELYKADPDAENGDERMKQLTTGKNADADPRHFLIAAEVSWLSSSLA